jgi:hypothetical protein
MKLNPAEIAFVRSLGLYLTEKCDKCGTLLNQSHSYRIPDRPEVYCSSACSDAIFFGNRREVGKHAKPGSCAYCGGSLSDKKRGALYCDETCRKAYTRKMQVAGDAANPKIPDTGLIESIASSEENRLLGQSSAPVGPDALRGTGSHSRSEWAAAWAFPNRAPRSGCASTRVAKLKCLDI